MKDLENDYFNAGGRIVSRIFSNIGRTADRIEEAQMIQPEAAEGIAEMWVTPNFYPQQTNLEETIRVYEQFEVIVPPLVFKPQGVMPGPQFKRTDNLRY